MEIKARFEKGRFVPLSEVRLHDGEIVELNLVQKKQFLWKGALKNIKAKSVELQHKIKHMW